MRLKIFFTFMMCGFLAPFSNVLAQAKPAPFENIRVYLSYQLNADSDQFESYWSNDEAIQLDLETPFYLGEFLLSGRYAQFSDKKEEIPAFQNYEFSVGWQIRHEVLPKLSVGAGVGTVFSMYYYEEITDEQWRRVKSGLGSVSPENEAGFFYKASLDYEFMRSWGIRLSLNRSFIFTKKRIEYNYLGLGLYKEFKTPKFIQEILK